MDKISKALKKLTIKEKEIVKAILEKIKNNSISDLDIKKLKGYDNIFRARKGKIRIIFSKVDENNINIFR
jgi:mRNA-degrading endonuclease RelE of RelBE toxin-antitoxin system